MKSPNGYLAVAVIAVLVMIAILFSVRITPAHARDLGQWDIINNDPAIRQWYQGLMQPGLNRGSPSTTSCCGEADAYWADEIHVRNGKTYAVITDDRPDEPRMRPHIDIGTEIEVPDDKIKWGKNDLDPTPQRNPTGHGVIFLSRARYVYCFVQPGGV